MLLIACFSDWFIVKISITFYGLLIYLYFLTFPHFLLKLEVWAREREGAGLKASINTLMMEIQRLNKLCEERKEAEDSLRKKWKKIEEFDARRSELESVYSALLRANMVNIV